MNVIGYVYRAEVWCPDCTIDTLTMGHHPDSPRPVDAEEYLDFVATRRGIDRMDEWTFDSGDFPKVILQDGLDHSQDACSGCGDVLA